MKYKFIGPKRVEIGELGIVEPGQEFDVNNELLRVKIFESKLFEVVKKEVKKVVIKKEKEGE